MSAERVFVAMSGGVDSSLAAALLKDQGREVVGVWMRLMADDGNADAPRCCGTAEAGEQARRAADAIGIPFYALDYAEVFGRTVVDKFAQAYAAGETPNPCVSCNAHVKFEALLHDVVSKLGGSRLATGHYARVDTGPDGRRRLLRARDRMKDQSYALYMLGPAVLERVELPIGELRDKAEVRDLAVHYGLPNATAPDSQDICFVSGDHNDLVRARAPQAFRPGPIERLDGTVVGVHPGIGALTVGQRRGVGAATGERLYVLRLEPEANRAVVGRRDEITSTRHRLRDLRFTAGRSPGARFAAGAVLRYHGVPIPAVVTVDVAGLLATVDLERPALVAPGQAIVLYDPEVGDEVLGGGVVSRAA